MDKDRPEVKGRLHDSEAILDSRQRLILLSYLERGERFVRFCVFIFRTFNRGYDSIESQKA